MNLSFPVFLYLTTILKRIRADYAIDTVFSPYVAAKCGKKAVDDLFKTAGTFFIEKTVDYDQEIDPEALKAAQERLKRIIAAKENSLRKAVEDGKGKSANKTGE